MIVHRYGAPLLASLLAASLAGCTIIIQPGGKDPVPVPVPIALQCVQTEMTPSAHIFFDMRIERTTVNLTPYYTRFMQRTALALAAASIVPTEAVLVRADERPVQQPVLAAWGCNLDDPEVLTPQMVIEHYATVSSLPESPLACATEPMRFVGEHLGELVTQYPAQLPGRSGLRMFGAAPAIVLVVHIDDKARRTAFDDGPCLASRSMFGDESGNASWLAYQDEIGSARVVHWFITTEEGIDRESFIEACKSYEGFPSDTLDIIDPSEKALYGPIARGLSDHGAQVATMPLCAMLVETEVAKFLYTNVHAIAELAGTAVDEGVLATVLGGGELPGLMSGEPDR